MRFAEENQWGMDLDWYAVDKDGHIGHFATNGYMLLPDSVAQSKEDWEKVRQFVRNELPSNVSAGTTSPELDAKKPWGKPEGKERYLRDFLGKAGRGLFSYDAGPMDRQPRFYFRVGIPTKPISIQDLPPEIREILSRTVLDSISFKTSPEITDAIIHSSE